MKWMITQASLINAKLLCFMGEFCELALFALGRTSTCVESYSEVQYKNETQIDGSGDVI